MEPTATPIADRPGEGPPIAPGRRHPRHLRRRPRLGRHRVKAEDVAIWHERQGMSPDEIVSAYPSLTLSDVHAVLAYYYENRDWIDADILAGERFVAEMRAQAGPSLVRMRM